MTIFIGYRICFFHCGKKVWRTVSDVLRKDHSYAAQVRINGYDLWVKEISVIGAIKKRHKHGNQN